MLFHYDRETLVAAVRKRMGKSADIIEPLIRPCAPLTAGHSGRSQAGGAPLTPAGFEWPRTREVTPLNWFEKLFGGRAPPPHPDGRPLAFIAQVDVADLERAVRESLNLPASGLLSLAEPSRNQFVVAPHRTVEKHQRRAGDAALEIIGRHGAGREEIKIAAAGLVGGLDHTRRSAARRRGA